MYYLAHSGRRIGKVHVHHLAQLRGNHADTRVFFVRPATVRGRTGGTVVVPRIVEPIRRLRPVEVRDVEFLRANTGRVIKITNPGPFTMSRQAKNVFHKDEEELVMDYAAAVNAEIRDLKAAGTD